MAIKSALGKQLGTQFDSVFDVVKSNPIYDKSGGKIPSLDLNFAKSKSLRDSRSTKNKITFRRASSGQTSKATFVGADGLIKTTPVNLKTNSEEVDTFPNSNVTVTANQFAAPNGTFTADRVDITTTNNIHSVTVGTNIPGSVSSTTSVYVKAISNVTEVQLRASISGGRASAIFDLVNGTSESAIAGNVIFADSSITPAGNGWYRISLTFTTNSASASGVFLSFTDGNADAFDDRSGQQFAGTNESMAVWGAQVEEGLVMNDYIPTTSTISGAPRFDHDPATGESLGLLIEESRTNSFVYSNDFSQSSTNFATGHWINQNSHPAPTQSVVGPDGVSNSGWKFFRTSTDQFFLQQVNGTGTFTLSAWVRSESATGSFKMQAFNFTDSLSPTVFTATNEWQRFSVTITVTANSSFYPCIPENINENFYVFGTQLEAGSFVTSYIPTSGSTVTRAVDLAQITGEDFAKTNLAEYSQRFEQPRGVNNSTGLNGGSSIHPNNISAPDGLTTADKFTRGGTGTGRYQNVLVTTKDASSLTYTYSIHFKKDDARYVSMRMQGVYPARADVVFDLDTGTIAVPAAVVGGYVSASSTITSINGGWYRCTLTATTNSDTNLQINYSCSAETSQIDGTSSVINSVYVWGAQLEEGDVQTDYTPSVETFVSRASPATYVDDATGLLETTPVNLLIYSEDFTQSIYTKQNGAVTTPTSDTTSPTSVSATFTPNTTNNTHGLNYTTSFNVGTLSIYAKSAGYDLIQLRIGNINLNSGVVNFDLTNGLANASVGLSGTSNNGTDWTINDYGIESVGNNWYRIHISYSTDNVTARPNVRVIQNFNVTDAPNATKFTGNGTSGVLLTGAQFEADSTTAPTDYIKTTGTKSGAARFKNNQLILEESRTNFALNSDSAQGSTLGSSIINSTENVVTPRGISETVRRLGRDSEVLSGQTWRVGSASGGTPNTTYTISFYAKTVSGGTTSINIDINDMTPLEGQETTITGEWTRIIKTGGSRNSALRFFDMNMRSDTNEEFYVFGAQIEAGNYATSYISTDSTVGGITRNPDVSTSALGVDSLYNQSEGTFFGDMTGSTGFGFVAHDGSNLNRHGFSCTSGTLFTVLAGISSHFGVNPTAIAGGGKFAYGYKANDYGAFGDGVNLPGTSPTVVPTGVIELALGFRGSFLPDAFLNGHIKRLSYFNTRLSDDKLKSITA